MSKDQYIIEKNGNINLSLSVTDEYLDWVESQYSS